MGDSDRESNTLRLCTKSLELSIKINMTNIARFLYQQDVLSKATYSTVTSGRSRLSREDCAHEVFMALLDAVEQDKDIYKMFLDHLRSEPRMHKIVEILEAQYTKHEAVHDAPKLSPNPIPQEAAKEGADRELVDAVRDPDKVWQKSYPDKHPPPDIAVVDETTSPDVMAPDKFSKDFSPKVFAGWMNSHYYLPTSDCNRIIEKDVSGRVFLRLDSDSIKEFGFVGAGYYTLLDALDEIRPTDSPGADCELVEAVRDLEKRPPPDIAAVEKTTSPGESCFYEAQIRGEYKPQLKLGDGDEITTIEPEHCRIASLLKGYYPMKTDTHGVALVINNMHCTDAETHVRRAGSDRDEYNLIETWRYLGYHVEVRRDVTKSGFNDIFDDIDGFLEKCLKSRTKVENDSFICCILSHGSKSCIYSSDSEEIRIKSLESGLGGSKILNSKPKLFFIQTCHSNGRGTSPMGSNLQSDGDPTTKTRRRADMYISYATAPEDRCYGDSPKGSWFIGAVCETLCKKSTSCSLNEMQHYINEGAAGDFVQQFRGMLYKQQPSCEDQLHKSVHFFLD